MYTNQQGGYTILYDVPGTYSIVVNWDRSLGEYCTIGNYITINSGEMTIEDFALPKGLSLLSPLDGATVSDTTPTFTWESNPEAVEYELTVRDRSTMDIVWTKYGIIGTSYTAEDPLSTGIEYSWSICGYDAVGWPRNWAACTNKSFTFTVE